MSERLSPGKIRGLSQLSSPEGIFAILACDQRGNMVRMMQAAGNPQPTYDDIAQMKRDIVAPLSPYATGALLDAEYGAGIAITTGALQGRCGLVVAVEATGYEDKAGDRVTHILPHWSVEKIKRLGASAVKLLLYYNPHRKAVAPRQEQLVAQIAEACTQYDIPFMLEGIVYATDDNDPQAFVEQRADLVIESARVLSQYDIDLYKVEFPVHPQAKNGRAQWEDACQRLNEACRTPWALLSAGVDFDTYAQQLEVACRAGASGFVAGRAIWREAVELTDAAARERFLAKEMPGRLQRLVVIAQQHARPWQQVPSHRYDAHALVPDKWYEQYASF